MLEKSGPKPGLDTLNTGSPEAKSTRLIVTIPFTAISPSRHG